mmetsp:Transcript_69932/g.186312  ORF Transcript_69932/g.186312 Transcript_69932/m.186312 type:complete len:899 (+) Transcript_69932:26-2722(+)
MANGLPDATARTETLYLAYLGRSQKASDASPRHNKSLSVEDSSDEVATYFRGPPDSTKSNGVVRAKVIQRDPDRDAAEVIIFDGIRAVVPDSWIVDVAQAGTAEHPWYFGVVPGSRQAPLEPAPKTIPEIWTVKPSGCSASVKGILARQKQNKPQESPRVRRMVRAAGSDLIRIPLKERLRPKLQDSDRAACEEILMSNGAREFRNLLRSTSDVAVTWRKLDANGDGRLHFAELAVACRKLKFAGNIKKLWEQLTAGGTKDLTLLAVDPSFRAEHEAVEAEVAQRKAEKSASHQKMQLTSYDLACQAEPVKPQIPSPEFKPSYVSAFRSMFWAQNINPYEGWDRYDSTNSGTWCFGEFVNACRDMGFAGPLQAVYRDLGAADRPLKIDDVCPGVGPRPAERVVAEVEKVSMEQKDREVVARDADVLRRLFRLRAEDVVETWGMADKNEDGVLCWGEFVGLCRMLGFEGRIRSLFASISQGRGHVLLTDMDPARKKEAKSVADRAAQRAEERQIERQKSRALCTSDEACRDIKAAGAEARAAVAEAIVKPRPPDQAEAFRQIFTARYVDPIVGWWDLDVNSDGQLGFGEFTAACRKLGLEGGLSQAFKKLSQGRGYVTLLDVNPKWTQQDASVQKEAARRRQALSTVRDRLRTSCAALSVILAGKPPPRPPREEPSPSFLATAFRKVLKRHYPFLRREWQAMDSNDDGRLTFAEFVPLCRRIGFEGPLRKVFEALTRGKEWIELGDIEPELAEDQEQAEKEAAARRAIKTERPPRRTAAAAGASIAQSDDGQRFVSVFRSCMKLRFRNLLEGWESLDNDKDGCLTFNEFVAGCRLLDLQFNMKAAFAALAKGKAKAELTDLDPRLGAEAAALKQRLAQQSEDRAKAALAGRGYQPACTG